MKKILATFAALAFLTYATTAESGGKKKPEPAPAAAPKAEAPAAAEAPKAEEKPTGISRYRHVVMEGMGKHMGAAGMILKGEVEGRDADLAGHAQALHDLGRDLPGMFPAGTGPDAGKTDAKAEVWTQRAEFEAAAKAYSEQTAKLVEVAKTGDKAAFGAQMGEVGKTCGGCHDTFRAED